tara:strand:- start:83 stop:808 length:726 start_codon:yes stop_codon:yes gene_type:complete
MKISEIQKDLAAVFRWSAKLDMHESVVNHFSMCESESTSNFYINKCGIHFSRIKASDLILVTAANKLKFKENPEIVDSTALSIHEHIHKNLPHARCVLHVHSKYATALSTLKDPTLYPVDQNSMMFFNRISYYNYGGMGFDDEATKMCVALGNKKIMLLANHGLLITGKTVAEAFNLMYYFEKAAETYLLALSTNKKINIVSDEIAEKTAKQWENYPSKLAENHLQQIKLILDKEEPEYRN